MNRKRLILAALFGVLLLCLGYAFWAMPRQEKAPPRSSSASRVVAKKAAAGKAGPVKKALPQADRLNLALLDRAAEKFPGARRDIFRFRGEEAIPVVEVLPVVPVIEEEPPPPPPPPPTPEELLRSVVSRLTYLGMLEKGGARSVFLSGGGEVFIIKAGEAFGKNDSLILREFSEKKLVIGWVKGPETVDVQFAENEALKPATMSSPPATGGAGKKAPSAGAPAAGGGGFPPRRILPQRILPQRPVEQPAEQPAPPPEAGEDNKKETEDKDE